MSRICDLLIISHSSWGPFGMQEVASSGLDHLLPGHWSFFLVTGAAVVVVSRVGWGGGTFGMRHSIWPIPIEWEWVGPGSANLRTGAGLCATAIVP